MHGEEFAGNEEPMLHIGKVGDGHKEEMVQEYKSCWLPNFISHCGIGNLMMVRAISQ